VTERDYCRAGNLKSVRIMLEIVRHLDPGDDTGVKDEEGLLLATTLRAMERRLIGLVRTRGDAKP
jgi:hypothetical protein